MAHDWLFGIKRLNYLSESHQILACWKSPMCSNDIFELPMFTADHNTILSHELLFKRCLTFEVCLEQDVVQHAQHGCIRGIWFVLKFYVDLYLICPET